MGKPKMDKLSFKNQEKSLGLLISLSFIILMIITVSIIAFVVFSRWKTSVDNTITKLEVDASQNIIKEIEKLVHLPVYINEMNFTLLEKGLIDLQDKKQREQFFASVIKANSEDIYSFSYGTENGDYYGARRNEKNDIEIYRSEAETNRHSFYYTVSEDLTAGDFINDFGQFDPRTREWYKAAKEKGQAVFAPLYKHFVKDDLTLSAAHPVYNSSGKLQGVLGAHITLSGLNRSLQTILQENRGTAYIIEKESGQLVANSLGKSNFTKLADGSIKRIDIEGLQDNLLAEAYDKYAAASENYFVLKTARDKLHFGFVEYKQGGLNWLVITAIPESIFTAEIYKNIYASIMLMILALILSILIHLQSTRIILKPINNLIGAAERFSKGDLLHQAKIYRNDEIGKLAKGFNYMAEQLYTLINNLEEKVKERTLELEQVNSELAASEENIRLLLDSTAEGIYGIDLNGKCTLCNASCSDMLGYEQAELIGRDMHDLIHNRYADQTPYPREKCKILRTCLTGEAIQADDEVLWRKDGTCFPAEFFSYPQYRHGKIIGAVVTFMDITERKQTQNELVIAKEQAEAANIEKSQFLANMSHEIRTPMNGIVGFLQLLEETPLAPEQTEFVKMIKTSTDSLLHVINDILDISKIEAGRMELEQISFDIRSTIESAVILFDAKAKEKGLELNLLISSAIPRFVTGDPTKLWQVISNLVNNAVKFTDQGEVFVEVSLVQEDSTAAEILFAVTDTGIGMSEQETIKLFKPFTQADTSSTRKYGGTGLGLAICHRLLQIMGGEIGVTSAKGKGSTFYFRVKFQKVNEAVSPSLPGDSVIKEYHPAEEAKQDKKLKILVVEDNEINKLFLIKLLGRLKFHCDIAENGAEAVQACLITDYDLIFMDCQMPVMDGYEATRQIRAKTGDKKHSIIVAMTAFAMKGDAEKCLEAGMDEYLSKPVNPEQVLAILEKYELK